MPRDTKEVEEETSLTIEQEFLQIKPRDGLRAVRQGPHRLEIADQATNAGREPSYSVGEAIEKREFKPSRPAPAPPPSRRDSRYIKPPSPLKERKRLPLSKPPLGPNRGQEEVSREQVTHHHTILPREHIPGMTYVKRLPEVSEDTSDDDKVPLKGLPSSINIGGKKYVLPQTDADREVAEKAQDLERPKGRAHNKNHRSGECCGKTSAVTKEI